jgi:uncharacterized iron-regulated membrane protein
MAATGTDNREGASGYLVGAVWRWHFYAGICVLPFVLVLAISGLAMLASGPLDRYIHGELLRVTPTGTPLAASAQVAAVAHAYPDAAVVTLRAGLAADESTPIGIVSGHAGATHGGGHGASALVTTVHVDPYTGTVLGEFDEESTVYAWSKKLHGTLLMGTAGDYLIEIAAGFGVLLIVTGVYLWWPRHARTVQQALLPPVAGAGRRRWRNLHAAFGAWTAPLLLFFFISGLAWTPFWGGALVQTWSSLPGESFDAPLAETTHASLDHGAHHHVPWAVEQTPLPATGSGRGAPGVAADGQIGVDDIIDYARAAGFAKFRVHFPRGEGGVWTVASTTIGGDTRELDGDRIVHLDGATGNVLADIRFTDYSLMGKLMAAGIPLHQGDTGLINLVVNVLICVAVITMALAAFAAWWARRPGGARRLVPPPLPRDARVWRAAVVLMLVLSIAFPLAALTIAAVLAVDFLLLRRVRAIRLIFD